MTFKSNATNPAQGGWLASAPASAWATLAVVMICVASSLIGRLALNVLVDPIRASLRLSDLQFSFLIGWGHALPFVAGSFLFGWLTDRYRGRTTLAIGMASWGTGTLLCAMGQDFTQVLAGRALIGFGESALLPSALRIIVANFPPAGRGRAIGIFFVVIGMGPGLGAALCGNLLVMAQPGGEWAKLGAIVQAPWRVVLLLGAAATAVLLPALLFVREPLPEAGVAQRDRSSQLRHSETRHALLMLFAPVVGLVLVNLVDVSTIAWAPAMLGRDLKLSVATAGNVFAAIAIGGGLGGPLVGGWLADLAYGSGGTTGRLRFCAATALLLAAVQALIGIEFTTVTVPALAVAAFCICALSPVGMTAIQEALPDGVRGTATGAIYALSGLLAGSGPTLVAAVSAEAGLKLGPAISLVTAPLAVLAATMFLVARQSRTGDA